MYPNVTEALVLEHDGCTAWDDKYKLLFPTMNFTWPEMLNQVDIDDDHKIWLFCLDVTELKEQQNSAVVSYLDDRTSRVPIPESVQALYTYLRPFVVNNNRIDIDKEVADELFSLADNEVNYVGHENPNWEARTSLLGAIWSITLEKNFSFGIFYGGGPSEMAIAVDFIKALNWD